MLEAHKIIEQPKTATKLTVIASFDERQKSRHKTLTTCGQNLAWFLTRGYVIADGDQLLCSDGTTVCVRAAEEAVSDIVSEDKLLLTKVAYHLGNRHVPVQIGRKFLRYQKDHVLDQMVEKFGLTALHSSQPFQPESGAYHNG